MFHFASRTTILVMALYFGSWLHANAQLGSARLEGLQISADRIHLSGNPQDRDCSISLRFTGKMADRAIRLSPLTVIEVTDDTGMNLVRTNQPPKIIKADADMYLVPPSELCQSVWGLKAPAPNAKAIRRLKAEVKLFMASTNTPILTNFMSQSGAVLHHATLAQYQLQIRFDGETNNPPPGSPVIDSSDAAKKKGRSVLLKVADPQHILTRMTFQRPNGSLFPATQQSKSVKGPHAEFTYSFGEVPPRDLNLAVSLIAPEATETVRFSLDSIRLPWVELPDFTAAVAGVYPRRSQSTNPCPRTLLLSFTGGPLSNALGIRNVWMNQAEDDFGKPINPGRAGEMWNWLFDALPPVTRGDGHYVYKRISVVFQSTDPKAIRVLKGEAELIPSSVTNDSIVTIKDFMAQPGKPFEQPLLKSNRVKLTYLGPVNYAAQSAEFEETHFVWKTGGLLPDGLPPKEVPPDTNNSLLFSLEDPDHAVIAPWGDNVITVLDDKGQEPFVVGSMTASPGLTAPGVCLVYRFKTLPPKGSQLRIYLVDPKSSKRIPFTIENIPLR